MATQDIEPKMSTPSPEQHIDLNGDVFEVPTFTIKEVRDAIPKHCLVPWTARSMGYVVRDFTLITTLAYLAVSYIPHLSSPISRFLAWSAYSVLQGMFFTGVWILAHECGHGAFSLHPWLNSTMGMIMHSFLLVPYHSWRLSHRQHHKATGHMERDMVFRPHTRESWIKKRFGDTADPSNLDFAELVEDAPVVVLGWLLVHQILGWFLYLLLDSTGREYPTSTPWWKKNHFYFGSDNPVFNKGDGHYVLTSDLGLLAIFGLFYVASSFLGTSTVLCLYLGPYLMVNHWIVLITFLQHTDASLPHYTGNAWTFTRGATATIDRDFGFIGQHLFHDIIETHVAHHLISSIPFYHAREATEAVKEVMGQSYRSDLRTNMFVAFWRNQRFCKFVEESVQGSGVVFYRNLWGIGAAPRDLAEEVMDLDDEEYDSGKSTPSTLGPRTPPSADVDLDLAGFEFEFQGKAESISTSLECQ